MTAAVAAHIDIPCERVGVSTQKRSVSCKRRTTSVMVLKRRFKVGPSLIRGKGTSGTGLPKNYRRSQSSLA